MRWQTLKDWATERRRELTWVALAVVLASGLLLCNLSGATNGSSGAELALAQQSSSLSGVLAQPQFMPLRFLHWVTGWLPGKPLLWARLPSALLAGLSLLAMTYIIRRWYGQRTAVLSFAVVACSAWLLHIGRLGTTDIMLYWALPTLIASHLLLYSKPSLGRLLGWLAVQSLLLYVPGMIWLVLINIWWQRQEIAEAWDDATTLPARSSLVGLGLVLLAPLAYSLYRLAGTTELTNSLFALSGLPQHWPSVLDAFGNIAQALAFIFVRGQAPDSLWLNYLPILDAFLAASFLLGVYFYIRKWQAFRSQLLLVLALVILALLALGGPVTISLLVPLIYLVLTAGLALALHYWVKTFPVNPLAKNFGIGLIALAVAVSCLYNLRSYFIAWPHNESTQAAFADHDFPKSRL